MRFLVDAQLPRQLAAKLVEWGHDALHTLDLPEGNRTRDREIRRSADDDSRVVITKDSDFVDSHLLSGSPGRLLLVSTGNISNHALVGLFEAHLEGMVAAFDSVSFIELGSSRLILHG